MSEPFDSQGEPPQGEAHARCPMDVVLRQVMGQWTTYILWLLHSQGPLRFGVLKAQIAGISSKVLTERLRQLEAAGLILRDYRPTIPPAVTYSLSTRGAELHEVLDGLNHIALKWAQEDAKPSTTREMAQIQAETVR